VIEKLERYACGVPGWKGEGDLVLASAARAREDALLDTLRDVLALNCSMDMGETSTQARILIRKIKETR
jgi:hypothetical protein